MPKWRIMSRIFTAVSPPITLRRVPKLSRFASFLLANMFTLSNLPSQQTIEPKLCRVLYHQTSLGILESVMSVDWILAKRKFILNMFKVLWKNESSALKPFLRKKRGLHFVAFLLCRREFNIRDLLVCWQPQWESQQGAVPLFRERKKKDKSKSEKMILVNKAWDQFMSADSESHNKGWYLRRISSKGKS